MRQAGPLPCVVYTAALASSAASALEVSGGRQDAVGRPAATIPEVVSAIRACWQVPEGLRLLERLDVTVRFSLRRDGSPTDGSRITYVRAPDDGHARTLLARSALDAVRNCTPVPLTDALGASLAGRPLTIRFIHTGPKGQGT